MDFLTPKTCVNHKNAEYVCTSTDCSINCAYVCLAPNDSCRSDHSSCSLIGVKYLQKACGEVVSKKPYMHISKLLSLQVGINKLNQRINSFVAVIQNVNAVKQTLDSHGLFDKIQKQYMNKLANCKDRNLEILQMKKLQDEIQEIKKQMQLYTEALKMIDRSLQKPNRQKYKVLQHFILPVVNSQMELGSQVKMSSLMKGSNDFERSPEIKTNSQLRINSQIKQKNSSSKASRRQNESNKFNSLPLTPDKNHSPKAPLFSFITNDILTIESFFVKKPIHYHLLYRASENEYSVNRFHSSCEGFTNTLTLVHNEHDKIIGGFTPLPWRSAGEWYSDESQTTFLFSITAGERFPLKVKEKAIWCSSTYGPSFGQPDLQIADKAHCNSNSCVNFPRCYSNANYNEHGSSEFLCGSKNGHFRIKQWEVYQIQF